VRGRPPKPTPLKILAGNPGRRPLNTAEPKPDPTPPACPAWLDESARRIWRKLAPKLSRLGLFTSVDGETFAAYCQACAELAWATRKLKKEGRTLKLKSGYLQQHPAVSMQRSAMHAVRQLGSLFGLDPSSRGRLEIEFGDDPNDPEEVDPLQEILNRGKAQA